MVAHATHIPLTGVGHATIHIVPCGRRTLRLAEAQLDAQLAQRAQQGFPELYAQRGEEIAQVGAPIHACSFEQH